MTDVSTTCAVVTGIKTESIWKLSNFNYQWTKTLYQNNLNKIAFFFTFFKGCRCNRLDFRRLPGPVFDPPRREGDECGLISPNSGW